MANKPKLDREDVARKRRRRHKPINEGSLRSISEWFFSPIYKQYRDENQSAKSFFDELFNVDGRLIQRWKVKNPFEMPGLFYLGGFVKVQGMGHRYMKKGLTILSRVDNERPETVDVECWAGQGKRDHCFCLDRSEWAAIQLNLELVKEQ